MNLHAGMRICELFEYEEAVAIARKYLGDLLDDPIVKIAMRLPLRTASEIAPKKIPPDILEKIDEELRRL